MIQAAYDVAHEPPMMRQPDQAVIDSLEKFVTIDNKCERLQLKLKIFKSYLAKINLSN